MVLTSGKLVEQLFLAALLVVPQLAGYSGFSGHRLVVGDVDERPEALGLRSGPASLPLLLALLSESPGSGSPRCSSVCLLMRISPA